MNSISDDANLRGVLKKYGLSEEDITFWAVRLASASEHAREDILKLFTLFPGESSWLRVLQEKKERALNEGNQALWEEIVHEEESRIAALPQ